MERRRLPPGVQRIPLAQRNHLLRDPARSLRPQNRGVDALFFDEVRHQVAQHGPAMRRLLPEF